ncbi:riboflavin synthase subunit alpha [Paraliobacillus quinghaiensis]|uniref:Riboflavin synthase n=1 Tax=Paraliobacillus quinghaiensis TaxID=470815 RepID=A0A917TR12_9BACI|nr:riboflavin synthase [Paraliobacillus quinghaiensis]GGM34048.1 riboflavin synthase subunit alpha [Paraliobacillus quinghaiensis]
MFTGIVEEKGSIKSVKKQANSLKLSISAATVLSDVKIGDSISVNGVCLTVTSFDQNSFSVDVMPETFRYSSLAKAESGMQVNLERAMHANGRFGGHFVSGHVDTVGEINRIWTEANARYLSITVDKEGLPYVMPKGSITVDGTSLTVFDVTDDSFVISLIPETQQATILGEKQQGDRVNLEYDMLAKYMERLVSAKFSETKTDTLTKDKLQKYGFIG